MRATLKRKVTTQDKNYANGGTISDTAPNEIKVRININLKQ